MSTPGKVLAVLVLLATAGWLLLAVLVADLNRNWGQEIRTLAGQVQRLEEDQVPALRAAMYDRLAEARQRQERNDRELTVLRAQFSHLQALEADLQEQMARVTVQIQTVAEATKDADATLRHRREETGQAQRALAASWAELQADRRRVDGLLADVQRLRSDFLAVQQENRRLLRQLGRGAGIPTAARTRPVTPLRAALPGG